MVSNDPTAPARMTTESTLIIECNKDFLTRLRAACRDGTPLEFEGVDYEIAAVRDETKLKGGKYQVAVDLKQNIIVPARFFGVGDSKYLC